MSRSVVPHFPNIGELARHCILTADGELGFLDRDGRLTVDPIATDAFRVYSQQLLHEYTHHPTENRMHLGVILENDGERPWKGLTIRLSDGLMRLVYPIPNQSSTDALTEFQKRNQWQSLYRGLELLLEYRVESMPDTPLFCPVILGREIDAASRKVVLGSTAEDLDESVPLLEIVNFVSLMTPSDKNTHAVKELIQNICAGVIYKSLRKPSALSLVDEESSVGQETDSEANQPATASHSVGIRVALTHHFQQIPIERLRDYETFSRLADIPLKLLARRMSIINLHVGDRLFERGSSDQYAYFLLEGTVELEAVDKRVQTIRKGEAPAKRPLSHLRPRQFTVRVLDDAKFLRIDYDQVTAFPGTVDKSIGAGSFSSWIVESLYEDLTHDRWVLAAIPALTRRVLQLMEQSPADTDRLIKLAAADPVTAIKILTAASHSAASGEQAEPVTTLGEAITRLQPDSVLSLVREIVDQDDYDVRNTSVRERLERLWRHSLEVACISHVLAQRTSGMDPERAWLHGLVHDIGMFAMLKYADRPSIFALSQDALEQVLTSYHGWIGGIILTEWGLPEEFTITNLEGDDWYRDTPGYADCCDVVVLAQLHHFMGTTMSKVVPSVDMVPVSAKVATGNLTPSVSVEILQQARQMANNTVRLLSV
jgi:HD-like signal output (HDOD) protein